MAIHANRPPDIVLTPAQAQAVKPLVADVVHSLSRRLEFHHAQLTGDQAAVNRAREEDQRASLDTSGFLGDDNPTTSRSTDETGNGGHKTPHGVLGRGSSPATMLASVGPGGQPPTVADLQQGAVVPPGTQPSTAPFGLPGGPTVGVTGVTGGLGGGGVGMGMGGMGMGMGGHGTSTSGTSGRSGVLGKADPDETWGGGARARDLGRGRGGTGTDSGGGGPPRGVLGR
ncbi:hypothetical protein [Streptomyces sp. NPDC005125]